VTSGARVDVIDFEPCGPLAWLDAAELKGLHSVVVAGAEASDDVSVVEWWVRMGRLIVADFCRRAYEQAAIDAKAAVIEAEEWRLACEARPATAAFRRGRGSSCHPTDVDAQQLHPVHLMNQHTLMPSETSRGSSLPVEFRQVFRPHCGHQFGTHPS
jgi:hypothetical protein